MSWLVTVGDADLRQGDRRRDLVMLIDGQSEAIVVTVAFDRCLPAKEKPRRSGAGTKGLTSQADLPTAAILGRGESAP